VDSLATQPGVDYVETDPVMHPTGSVTPTDGTLSTIYPRCRRRDEGLVGRPRRAAASGSP